MATATRSPLVEQAEKIDRLAQHLSNGQLLEKAVRLAGSDSVWRGALRDGFMGWIAHALDFWMRNQLAEGMRLVARSLFNRAADIERAQQAMAAGQVGVVGPGIPAPLNYAPGTPPSYGSIGGPGVVPEMNGQEVRGLSHLLLATADDVLNFGRTVEAALDPPPAPPPPPGAPPTVSPVPPDADAAVGFPHAYLEIATQLRNAASDLARRADEWLLGEDASLPGMASVDLGVMNAAAQGAAAVATSSGAAADQAQAPGVPTATPEDQVPQPPVEEQQRDAEALARDYPPDKVLDDPRELKKLAAELDKHQGHEAFAARFVEKFGAKNVLAVPRALQAWQNGWEKGQHTLGPGQRSLPFGKPQPEATKEDIESVLYGFSGTLATATRSEHFDQKVEDQILATKDPLALSWLLSDHDAHFDADFLVEAFEHGVKDVILKEASLSGIGSPYATSESPLELRTGKLYTDPKIAVLNAISRNEEAAMRIADIEFKPPLKVYFGLRPDVEVKNIVELLYQGGSTDGGYGDKGAALGRMLDTAHRGFCDNGDAASAKRVVDQITKGATNDKDVKRAEESLRRIGARQPVTDEEASNALANVRKDDNHPARELLLTQAAERHSVSATFVADAASGKKYAGEVLYETRSAWDVVRKSMTDPNGTAEQRADAEKALERTITKVGKGEELSNEARRGMADNLALRFGDLAYVLFSPISAPAQGWVNASKDDLKATLAEVARDKEARETLMLGIGAWSSKTYDEMATKLAAGSSDNDVLKKFAPEMMQMGDAFCQMITAVQEAGVKERDEALALLQRYRFGVDIVFDLVEQIPVVTTAKASVDSALGHLPGGIAPDYEEALRSGIAKNLSGVDMGNVIARTKAEALSTVSQVDVIVIENMMSSMARKPTLMVGMGLNTWGSWPAFMLREPPPPSDASVDPTALAQFVKPEYMDPAGGVRFPLPGTPDYGDFQEWYLDPSLDNPLLEQASFITAEVRNSMNTCMMKIQWEKSL